MDKNVGDSNYRATEELPFAKLKSSIEHRKDDDVTTILYANPSLLSIVDDSGQTLLHVATKHKNLSVMEYLIKKGCDVEAKTNVGWTPFMIALDFQDSKGDPRCSKMLFNYGADLFAANLNGESALEIYLKSVSLKNLPVIKALFENEKIRRTSNKDLLDILEKAKCPLRVLVHFRNAELTKLYLDTGNRLSDPQFGTEATDAMLLCMKYNYEENLRVFLYSQDAEIAIRRFIFIYEFCHTVRRRKHKNLLEFIEIFVRLLVELISINRDIAQNVTDIFLKSNKKALCELLKTNLNSFIKKECNYDPIAYVFGNRNPGILDLIQKQNIDINLCGRNGESVLHIALKNKVEKHVNYLLKKNCNPNMINNYGKSPIFYIFIRQAGPKCNECVKLLLKSNADMQICNYYGKTFVQYVQYTAELEQPLKTIFAHLAILRACNVPIKAPFIDFLNSNETLAKFYKTACLQLEQMKMHKIHGSLTIFSTLTQSYDFVSHRIRTMHPNTVKTLGSLGDNSLAEYHDYYIDIIRNRVQVAYEVYKMRKKAVEIICSCIDQLQGNVVIVDNICSFVNYEHLHKIVYPSHDEDCKDCNLLDLGCYQFVKQSH